MKSIQYNHGKFGKGDRDEVEVAGVHYREIHHAREQPRRPGTTEKEFYIPHKAVVRESAESTKVQIVYDASAKANEKVPSLNDCLETGLPIQNKLWSVLTRNRFHPVALAGDLKQAFLHVRVREEDSDVLRFHWLTNLQTKQVETLRFTRALFGLTTSPFLLGGVIDQHLKKLEPNFSE